MLPRNHRSFKHSFYMLVVINYIGCPKCSVPTGVECGRGWTHQERIKAYYKKSGMTVDETYKLQHSSIN
jgi:hypothetical protein